MAESQFRQILQMGQHIFYVMFVHQLLCRQLMTTKLYELWWMFTGKPIWYGIGEFALVTGLNCGKVSTTSLGTSLGGHPKKKGKSKGKDVVGSSAVLKALFGTEDKITLEWILSRLALGEKYKDSDTCFKLALFLLVEGILCHNSGSTSVRPEVVELVDDIDAFLKYPWDRESFFLIVNSVKAKTTSQYAAETTAFQGFAHAIVLVTICSCPTIISDPGSDADLDVSVTHVVSLIKEDFPFENNIWRGGVKATDARNPKSPVEDGLKEQDLQGGSTNTHPLRPNTVPPPPFGGCFTELEVRRIIRSATDDVEESLEAMLAGYFASLQGYMADDFRKINEVGIYHGPFEPRQPETWVN
ncbi:hypothetical protein N665_0403s0013 [Sinapis alba]|nr:hypothetical protein N665_0403s0013 [Sinapis alba]